MTVSPQYLAGLIDGEGCLMVSRSRKPLNQHKRGVQFSPCMTIANTSIPLLEAVQQDFGGKIRIEHANTYALLFSANEQRVVIPKVFPYLILKKREATILLNFLSRKAQLGCRPLSDEDFKFYEECYLELRRLKKIRHTYNWSSKPVGKRLCQECQGEFVVYSHYPHRKFCSEHCRAKFHWTKSNARIRAGVPAWSMLPAVTPAQETN